MQTDPHASAAWAWRGPWLILGFLALTTGCAPEQPLVEGKLTREEFVAVYVELRVGALKRASGEIPPEERDRILANRGLTQEDLLAFVELHGRDVEFMNAVWDDVEEHLQAVSNDVDSATVRS